MFLEAAQVADGVEGGCDPEEGGGAGEQHAETVQVELHRDPRVEGHQLVAPGAARQHPGQQGQNDQEGQRRTGDGEGLPQVRFSPRRHDQQSCCHGDQRDKKKFSGDHRVHAVLSNKQAFRPRRSVS